MSDVTTIDGFLTLNKGSQTLVTNESSVLYIGASADGENWVNKWHIKDVSLPMSLAEADKMFEDGMASMGDTDDSDAWFDMAFTERNGTRTFKGKAMIHTLAQKGVKVTLQGTTELTS
jgi:hypothetical protein